MPVLSMSRAEIDRGHVLRDLLAERIHTSEAAALMGVTPRQVFRLIKAYHLGGPAALVSKKRGELSNRSYPALVRTQALALIKASYADFGPTLATEKLAERHDLHLGVETVRRWMLADGIWRDRRRRLKPMHQPRYRRECLVELIQIDLATRALRHAEPVSGCLGSFYLGLFSESAAPAIAVTAMILLVGFVFSR